MRQQGEQSETGEDDRSGVGAGQVEGLEALLDVQRERLGSPDDLARDDRDGAVLAERACGREDDAVGRRPSGSPGASRARTSASGEAPSVAAACSCSVADLAQDRGDLADDEGQRDEDGREHHPREGEDDADPCSASQPPIQPSRP